MLNLNYDLVFDVALKNVGRRTVYSPHERPDDGIWAFKPHGSFHLAVDEGKGFFLEKSSLLATYNRRATRELLPPLFRRERPSRSLSTP